MKSKRRISTYGDLIVFGCIALILLLGIIFGNVVSACLIGICISIMVGFIVFIFH